MGKLKSFSFLKRPKVIIPAAAVVLLAAAVVLAVHNLTAPAVGSINQTPPSQAEQVVPYSQPGVYRGKYVTFSYPAHFKVSPAKTSGGALEVVYFSSADISGRHIAVDITKENLTNDGDVLYRQRTTSLYKENTSRLGLEFTKTDGTEDTFFMTHNGLVASVSASSPINNLSGEALFVASSLKWL